MTTKKKQEPKDTTPSPQKKVDYIRTIGRRKTSSARVRIYPKSKGEITINNKKLSDFFPYTEHANKVLAPFKETSTEGKFDVTVKVVGGGVNSQAEAIRHGIARALIKHDPGFKPALKAAKFLTRDPRAKERKKPGLKRARKSPQWSKR